MAEAKTFETMDFSRIAHAAADLHDEANLCYWLAPKDHRLHVEWLLAQWDRMAPLIAAVRAAYIAPAEAEAA